MTWGIWEDGSEDALLTALATHTKAYHSAPMRRILIVTNNFIKPYLKDLRKTYIFVACFLT